MEHPSGPVLAWFGHPATVAATLVLPVNDHVLKALWPGLVTGKLSDVAGLLVAPPLLALALVLVCVPALALLRAPSLLPALIRVAAPVAIVATGAGFTMVKTTQEGAEFASRAWSTVAIPSRILADPADLLALPALGAAWLIWRRCEEGRSVRRFRASAVIPVALVAVTATAPVPPPPSAERVLASDGTVTVFLDHGAEVSSRDGGRTWTYAFSETPGTGAPTPTVMPSLSPRPASPEPAASPRPASSAPIPKPDSAASAPSSPPGTATRTCLPGEPLHCYRVVPPRLAVHESRDGGNSWNTVWAVSEGRQDALRRKAEHDPRVNWQGSTAIAVQPVPGGHVVVAANGHDGIALRDARGDWRRLGLLGEGFSPEAAPPLDAPGVDLRAELQTGVLAGLLCLMIGLTMARRHAQGPIDVPAYVLVLAAYLLVFPVNDPGQSVMVDVPALLRLFGGVCLLIPAVVSTVKAAIRTQMITQARFVLIATACATPFSIWMLFSAWESGVIDHYRVAGVLAWLVAGLGIGTSALVGRTGARRAEEETKETKETREMG